MKILKFTLIFMFSTQFAFAMYKKPNTPKFEYCKVKKEEMALNDKIFIRFGNEYIPGTIVLIQNRMLGDKEILQYGIEWKNKQGVTVSGLINPNYIYKKQISKYYT